MLDELTYRQIGLGGRLEPGRKPIYGSLMRPLRLSDVVLDRLISPVNERFWEWSEIGRYTFGSLRPNQSNQTTSLPRFHSHVSLLQTLYKGREVDQFGVVRHAYNSIEYQGIADKL